MPGPSFGRKMQEEEIELRFIEYMDVGRSNGWDPQEVVRLRRFKRK